MTTYLISQERRRELYKKAFREAEERGDLTGAHPIGIGNDMPEILNTGACPPQQLFDFGATYRFGYILSLEKELLRQFGVEDLECEIEVPKRWGWW